MLRERALKLVLIVAGSLFSAGVYPIMVILWRRDKAVYTDAILLTVYVSLGILLLMAVRKPSAHRSLIAFAGGLVLPNPLLWPLSRSAMPVTRKSWASPPSSL